MPDSQGPKVRYSEFMLEVEIELPGDMSMERMRELHAAETQRAGELAAGGNLIRVWRIPGRRANRSLWRAQSATDLHAMVSSLPLWPWMDVHVVPLAEHPNDPAPS